ncbi:hypothetical protein Dimus_028544, partial [Dionaea muscipula]
MAAPTISRSCWWVRLVDSTSSCQPGKKDYDDSARSVATRVRVLGRGRGPRKMQPMMKN